MKQDYLQMRVLELAPEVYASGQLFVEDFKLAAKQGVRSVVCHRADGESPGQPSAAELTAVAQDLGMNFVSFPVHPKNISVEEVAAFAKLCEGLDRPMIVFSRTGARATRLWEMAEDL